MANLKVAPIGLKALQPYLKIAAEHDKRDPAISYWCRYYAVQHGLKITDKLQESTQFLIAIMNWLETVKKAKSDDETIVNDVVAQAHTENYALKLFLWADNEDRCERFNINTVKSFYTAGLLYDVVNVFGEPSEEVLHHKKYAKWKSTYINNCLKNGIIPTPGPVEMQGGMNDEYPTADSMSEESIKNHVPQQPHTPYPLGFNSPTSSKESSDFLSPSSESATNDLCPSTSLAEPSSQDSVMEESNFIETKTGSKSLTPKDFHKAQKLCKTAESALRYEDVPTAIQYLQRAFHLLTTGEYID